MEQMWLRMVLLSESEPRQDIISRKEKGKWFDELLRLQEEIAEKNIEKYIGKTYRVICDDFGSSEGYMSGHTNGTAVVEFKADEEMLGRFVDIKINSYEGVFKGEIIN